jgi:hypothetical protein
MGCDVLDGARVQKRMKRMLTIFDSLTADELGNAE